MLKIVSKGFVCKFSILSLNAMILLIGLLHPQSLLSQTTTASLRGVIASTAGAPVEGATVVLEHLESNSQKSTVTNADGAFAFTGLRVGGPYRLSASKVGFTGGERTDVSLKAGSNPPINLALGASEVMQVTAVQGGRSTRGKLFDSEDIRSLPSVSQDPKDIVRLSPNAYVDGDSLSIGGANNRFNSFTVDGMRQDDDFGLNGNGYPTQRSPVSLLSVEELSVETSPFDVRYGNFLGGNVNVVTKSGGNEFESSIMTTYSGQSLTGSKSKDKKYDNDFEENRLGFALSGPIVEDKLHFFLNAEGLKSTAPNTFGVAGSGKPNEVNKVTATDVQSVQEISKNVYSFDAGKAGQSFEEEDFKLLAKVDWAINNDHRLEAKYQKSTGNNINAGESDDEKLFMTSTWYDKKETLDTMSLRLLSDWSYALSTKLEVSTKKVETRQEPLSGNDFMNAEIATESGGEIFLGPDPDRHANKLDNESLLLKAEANYLAGDHLITAGTEFEKVDVTNLYVRASNGVASFDSIEDFANRSPSSLYYRNAITNNPLDAVANWGYHVNTFYLQDELQLLPNLTAKLGVRAELYGTDDEITRNENFYNRYGFDNTATIQGKQVFLPRLGFNYQASNRLNLFSGFGLYSGGTPNVWISNTYNNDGVRIDDANLDNVSGFDGRNIPEGLTGQLQAGQGNVDALDPDFKIPQSWKFSFGGDYRFDIPSVADNFVVDFNYTYSKVRYGLLWKDLRRDHPSFQNNQSVSVGPDGRPIYDSNFDPNRGYDLLLTNTDKGFGHNATLSLSKSFQSGFNFSTAYGWQRVQDVNPGTSSTAASNYGKVAVGLDPNNPDLATSNYERTHRFLVTAGYSETFFSNLLSSVSLFLERRSGQPYSYTFGGNRNRLASLFGESRDFSRRNRMLFYVPKGDGSDVILDGIDEGAFNAYLKKTGLDEYRGKIAPRNAFKSSWVDQIDMRLSQELPAFTEDHRARFVLDVENLPNLLNKKWGQVKQVPSDETVPVVDVDYDAESGRYIYSNFNGNDRERVNLYESVWKIQLAVYYDF